jgi:hypothetical protein
MSTSYTIHRWDAMQFTSSTPCPVAYIHPDQELHKFSHENGNSLLVRVFGTDCRYNDRYIIGRLFPSSVVPNERPNYFEKTGLYVLVLEGGWKGYPNGLGSCQIFGTVGGIPTDEPGLTTCGRYVPKSHVPKKTRILESYKPNRDVETEIDHHFPLEKYTHRCNTTGMDNSRIIAMYVGLCIIMVSVMIVMRKK